MAAIKRRQGKWEESTASYEKAISLDPKDPILLENMGWNYRRDPRLCDGARRFSIARSQPRPTPSPFASCGRGWSFTTKGDLRPMRAAARELAGECRSQRHDHARALQLSSLPAQLRGAARDPGAQPGREIARRNQRADFEGVSDGDGLRVAERRGESEGALRRSAPQSRSGGGRKPGGRPAACIVRPDLRGARPLRGSDRGRKTRGRVAARNEGRV